MLVLNLFIETWGWTPEIIFWRETLALVVCSLLAVFMWLSARANFKIQEKLLLERIRSNSKNGSLAASVDVPKKEKTIVFPTEGQVTVIKEKKSSTSVIETGDVTEETVSKTSLRSLSANIEKLSCKDHIQMMCNHLKILFKNPIFVILIIVVFCMDGTVVCLTGILKRFLKDKFNRREKQIGFEMGLTKYFGFAAPIAGHIIDKVRNREYFMLLAGLCLVFGLFALYVCSRDDVELMYICLLIISFGRECRKS